MTHHKLWTYPSRVVAYITDTCDQEGNPSLVKMLCAAFAVVCIVDMRWRGVGAANSALCIVCLATAFGRSTFLAWLNRYTTRTDLSASATFDTKTNITVDAAAVVKAINERRDPAQGIESSGKVPQTHND